MIRFPCGTCGKRLRVPARLAGKRGRCEVCGAINRVPLADVPAPPAATEHRNQGARPSAAASRGVGTTHPKAPTEAKTTKVEHPIGESPAKPPETHADPARQPPPAVPRTDPTEPETAPAPTSASIHEPIPVPSDEPPAEPEPVVVSEDVPASTVVVPRETPSVDETGGIPLEDHPASPPNPPADDDLPVVAPAPPVLAVDVRRTDGPSPFRSTADITPRETIEGTVALPNAQFAADGRPIAVVEGADANRTVENFLDLVQRRTAVVDPSEPRHEPEPDEPPLRVLHVDVDVIDDEMDAAATAAVLTVPSAWRPHHAEPPPPRAAHERAAVIVALIVGLILGFCLGLLASEWL